MNKTIIILNIRTEQEIKKAEKIQEKLCEKYDYVNIYYAGKDKIKILATNSKEDITIK